MTGPHTKKIADNSGAYVRAEPVVKSDVTVIDITDAIHIGIAGDLVVRMANQDDRTFTEIPVGIHKLAIDQVLDATAALNMLALYHKA